MKGARIDDDDDNSVNYKGSKLPHTTARVSVDDIGPRAIEQIVTAAQKRADTEIEDAKSERTHRPRDRKDWKQWP